MSSPQLSQRTFSKSVLVREQPTATFNIQCYDSSGQTINCNYFSVNIAAVSGLVTPAASPFVAVSPINGTITSVTPLSHITASTTVSSLTASSPLGVGLLISSGVTNNYEYLCLPTENFNVIRVVAWTPNPVIPGNNFAYAVNITYGIVQPFNSEKLEDRYTYNLGS